MAGYGTARAMQVLARGDARMSGGRLRCRTVCAKRKNKAADGSLVRYLHLMIPNLFSPVFSGLGDFFPKKSSSGVWGGAPYITPIPHVGVRGAQPRIVRSPAERGDARNPYFLYSLGEMCDQYVLI